MQMVISTFAAIISCGIYYHLQNVGDMFWPECHLVRERTREGGESGRKRKREKDREREGERRRRRKRET